MPFLIFFLGINKLFILFCVCFMLFLVLKQRKTYRKQAAFTLAQSRFLPVFILSNQEAAGMTAPYFRHNSLTSK